jgi:hypothetical protein
MSSATKPPAVSVLAFPKNKDTQADDCAAAVQVAFEALQEAGNVSGTTPCLSSAAMPAALLSRSGTLLRTCCGVWWRSSTSIPGSSYICSTNVPVR